MPLGLGSPVVVEHAALKDVRRLGEFTIGTELHRSESLALVQLLILYHLVTARAAVALGGEGTRTPTVVAVPG